MDIGKVAGKLKNKKVITIALVAVLLLAFGPTLLSIVPGPEGVRGSHYGVQFGLSDTIREGSAYDALPSGFTWTDNSPSSYVITKAEESGEPWGGYWLSGPTWWYDHGSGQIRSEIQHPVIRDDPVGLDDRTLEYYKYVKVSDTEVEIRKVVVDMVSADFVIQISAVPGQGIHTWEDLVIWYELDTVTWMNAYKDEPPADPDPLTNDSVELMSSNYRGAFPIIGWIEEYKDWIFTDEEGLMRSSPPNDESVAYVQLSPDLEGRFIDLYTTPGTTYTLATNEEVLANPEAALRPSALPDPRFAENVYFKITALNFGAYVEPTGLLGDYSSCSVWYPSVYYRVHVVYAIYGEYVYLWTEELAEEEGYDYEDEWEARNTTVINDTDPIKAFFDGLNDWLGNPWNLFGLGLFGVAAIATVAVIVLVWFFGWGALVPKRRRK